jgi:pimeloyl-ACP methyl ester carboxylesterase
VSAVRACGGSEVEVAVNKTPKLRAVLAAAVMILAGLGYLVAQYVGFMADPNPRGSLSVSQAALWPASALAIMVGLGLLVAAAADEFGRRPQILLGITFALLLPLFVIAPLASATQAWWLELTAEPAYVFGSSLGALIGLALIATHPDQVRLLVAHEAAVAQLLPEPDRSRLDEAQRDVDDTFWREGPAKAIPKMFAISGVATGDDPEPGTAMPQPSPESMARHQTNFVFFLANDAPAAHGYQLDLVALVAASAKIVPAAGAGSGGSFPHRSAAALADRLDKQLVEMPGGHSGYVRRPRAFAAALDEILRTNSYAAASV